jgi:hypoxanthine-DNA glycosylase
MRVQSFKFIADAHASVLILGSMPGEASLRAQQYYAHPRNLFWPIMGELVGAAPQLAYAARIARLKASGIALWDVLESCAREGSLDAHIEAASLVPNDFAGFFRRHPRIARVCFNGAAAEAMFLRHVMPLLRADQPALALQTLRLPSTSPAHAAMSYEKKLAAWRAVLGQADPGKAKS